MPQLFSQMRMSCESFGAGFLLRPGPQHSSTAAMCCQLVECGGPIVRPERLSGTLRSGEYGRQLPPDRPPS